MTVPDRLRGKTIKCPNTVCGKPIAFPVAVAELPEELPLELPEKPRKRRWPIVAGVSVLLLVGVSVGAFALKGKMYAKSMRTSRTSEAKSPAANSGDSTPGSGRKEFDLTDSKPKKTSLGSNVPATGGVIGGEPRASTPGGVGTAGGEFARFAQLASMESYEDPIAYGRLLPGRAKKLQAMTWTDPTLRAEVDTFVKLAGWYCLATDCYNVSRGKQEELDAFFSDTLKGEGDRALSDVLAKTATRVAISEFGEKTGAEARQDHARLWARVLAKVEPTGGGERERYPLRVGLSMGNVFFRNTTGRPLTNLTVAVTTRKSKTLPEEARLHVVALERLEADEYLSLPAKLIDKLSEIRQNRWKYLPGDDALTVSVWCDQAQFRDVVFDAKTLPERAEDLKAAPYHWCQVAFRPAAPFRGQYDFDSPWPNATPQVRPLSARRWYGKDDRTGEKFTLWVIGHIGVNVLAMNVEHLGTTGGGGKAFTFEGTLRGTGSNSNRLSRDPRIRATPTTGGRSTVTPWCSSTARRSAARTGRSPSSRRSKAVRLVSSPGA